MFINQVVIAVVFRLLNFGIVVGLAFYLFRKYGLPVVYTMMAEKDAKKEFLLSQQLLLEQKQRELDDLIGHDLALSESIKLKVNEWRDIAEKEQLIREQDRLKRSELLHIKKRKKSELLAQTRLQEAVAAAVLADLQKSLTHHFENNDAASEYLDSMVQIINERAS